MHRTVAFLLSEIFRVISLKPTPTHVNNEHCDFYFLDIYLKNIKPDLKK